MREILFASIETLGMAPSWAALIFGIAAVVIGGALALRLDRPIGSMVAVGGGVAVVLVLAAMEARTVVEGPGGLVVALMVVLVGAVSRMVAANAPSCAVAKLLSTMSLCFAVVFSIIVAQCPPQDFTRSVPIFIALAATDGLARVPIAWALLESLSVMLAGDSWVAIAVAAGPIVLALALLYVWFGWSRRRRDWLTAPERLIERPAPPLWLAVAASTLAIIPLTAIADDLSVSAILGLACGAIGVLTFGHLAGRPGIGEVGLALAAAMLAAIVVYIGGPGAVPAGAALGGLWMMWLARFWGQQLHEGAAWTTAGRLIPSARRIGAAAAFVLLFTVWVSPPSALVLSVVSLVFGLALVAALTLAARREQCGGSAIGALAAAAGVALLAVRLPADALPAFLAPTLAAALVAVLGGPVAMSRNKDGEIVRAAWIGVGAVTLVGIAISRPEEPQLFVAASITLIAGLLYAASSRRPRAMVDSQS